MGNVGPFLGIDHTGVAVGDLAAATRFLRSVFGLSLGDVTDNQGPEQADLDDLDDAHVGATSVGPDMPPPGIELWHYHVGTRRPIPRDSAGNDIAAIHFVVHVASLEAVSAALARYGLPLAGDDIVVLREGRRAALVKGPERRRFWWKKRTTAQTHNPVGINDLIRPLSAFCPPLGRLSTARVPDAHSCGKGIWSR